MASNEKPTVASEARLPIWRREIHPGAIGASLFALLFLISYIAYMNNFLPIKPKSEFESRLGQLVRASGGHFDKLKAEDQKYLNEHTAGRGAMAMAAYQRSNK